MNNNNKYYLIQLLEDNRAKKYYVWQRWGRGTENPIWVLLCGKILFIIQPVQNLHWDSLWLFYCQNFSVLERSWREILTMIFKISLRSHQTCPHLCDLDGTTVIGNILIVLTDPSWPSGLDKGQPGMTSVWAAAWILIPMDLNQWLKMIFNMIVIIQFLEVGSVWIKKKLFYNVFHKKLVNFYFIIFHFFIIIIRCCYLYFVFKGNSIFQLGSVVKTT